MRKSRVILKNHSSPSFEDPVREDVVEKKDIGLIGLGVMGENLALNMESHGFSVAVYNRTTEKVGAFIDRRAKGKNIKGCMSTKELVESLERPRKMMLLVKAGKPVDEYIDRIIPNSEQGDIIIDGGNSHFLDTIRRTEYVESKGLLYLGTGISGGEEGALLGPSIMPGGSTKAWPHMKRIFQSIAAKAHDGLPCCDWVGEDGAGHFVKMVHNGIEYADMQMICEAYSIMKTALDMSPDGMQAAFGRWNEGELNSYLIEITKDILGKKDDETGEPMLDVILDTAGQKGTGKWASQAALDLGCPAPTVTEAVFARAMSAIKEERVAASRELSGPASEKVLSRTEHVEMIRKALYASKICSYAQGYQLMKLAAEEYNWDLDFGNIALMWRGGCIIRAQFLDNVKKAFDEKPKLQNLLLDDYFKSILASNQTAWRQVVSKAIEIGIPVPAFSSALAYYDGYRSKWLPANMLQAQRDYFGAHSYERIDRPRGEFFHTDWTGEGGAAVSSTYNV